MRAAASRTATAGLSAFVAVWHATVVGLCAAAPPIEWRSAPAAEQPQTPADVQALTLTPGQRHIVLQFDTPPTDAVRQDLSANGVMLLRFLGSEAWFARVDGGLDAARVVAEAGAQASTVSPGHKLHPMLLRGEVPAYARAALSARTTSPTKAPASGTGASEAAAADATIDIAALCVIFHADVDPSAEGAAAIGRHGGIVRSIVRSINTVVAWVPVDAIPALAAEDVVQWIEPPLPPLTATNDSVRQETQVEVAQAPPYNLRGTGVNVLVYDAGAVYTEHPDFGGRAYARDATAAIDHATHVAGIIGGDGASSDGLYRGMAPAVQIESYGFEVPGGLQPGFLYTDPGDLEQDYRQAITLYGVHVANNSIGSNVASNGFPCEWEGNYGATEMLIDAVVRGSLGAPVRIVWSTGNERGDTGRCGTQYNTIAPPAGAKNSIAVGAVNSDDDSMTDFSSWGPVDDGRLKPDVCAPGCQTSGDGGVTSLSIGGYRTLCGTSMASPAVTGIAALLLEDWTAAHPDGPLPANATIKALLVHTAADLGNPGPDYRFGYGAVRAKDAIDFLRIGSFVEEEVPDSIVRFYAVTVPTGAPALKVTLAWDDPPAALNVASQLVNDLDLTAVSPSGATYYPWTLEPSNPSAPALRTKADHRNNVEQVVVDAPEPGLWTVRVTGTSVPQGPQTYTLATTPELRFCTSAGLLRFSAEAYPCGGVLTVSLIDCELNTNAGAIESFAVPIVSNSDPTGTVAVLTETSAGSATFVGTVPFTSAPSPGGLYVQDGDTVLATYHDLDVGTGASAYVYATAVVDCTPPIASDVHVTDIGPVSATIRFETNEPARATVRFGLSCGALTRSVTENTPVTSHAVTLTGLDLVTTQYFTVEVRDVSGNTATVDPPGECRSFATSSAGDYFTEYFAGNDNDLDYRSIIFTPDNSNDFYAACAESIDALPTDPAGGTEYTFTTADEGRRVYTAPGRQVWLYGVPYNQYTISSNGYIVLGPVTDDSLPVPSPVEHFRLPRVSGLYVDLWDGTGNPGTISRKLMPDREVITWDNVPLVGTFQYNTFQIELYYDGRVRLSYLALAAQGGLAGLSAGVGVPGAYVERDLTRYGPCAVGDFDGDGDVDLSDFRLFQLCFNGPQRPYPFAECRMADFDHDVDVDLADFMPFLSCFNGPLNPPACQP